MLQALGSHTSTRSNLNSYLFFIVIEGTGMVEYQKGCMDETKEVELHKGDCFFIDCINPYSHCSSKNAPWTLKWVHFAGFNMQSIYKKYQERGGKFHFSPNNANRYISMIDEIYITASSDSYVRDMEISAKLTKLLTMLMEDAWAEKNENEEFSGATRKISVKCIKDYIDENFEEKLSLEELSKLFFIDKYYLSKVFKEQYGITINNYILQLRITKAKNLLRFSSDTIEKIGEKVGISNPNYFSRSFRKVEGVSPREYRKKW